MVEGIAAVAIVFILFTLVVQLSIALVAHQAAEAAVASAARRASLRPGSEEQLMADLRATVPGAGQIDAGVVRDEQLARAWARFEFRPPGPMFRPLVFLVEAEVPIVVAP